MTFILPTIPVRPSFCTCLTPISSQALSFRMCTTKPRQSTPLRNLATATALALSLTLTNPFPSHSHPPPNPFPTSQSPFPTPTRSLHSPILISSSTPASKASTPSHRPSSYRLSAYLQNRNIPPFVIILIVASLPVLELRASIPLGYFLNLPPLQTFILSILGNLVPILPTLLLLRLPLIQSLTSPYLSRARRKAKQIGNADSRALALALFVAVPLPGTGAWTGSFVAFILGMGFAKSCLALSAGVVGAALLVSALCMLGWLGLIGAALAVVGGGGVALVKAARKSGEAGE